MMRLTAVLSITLAFALPGCGSKPEDTGTVIINARIIDGSGGPARQVNVRFAGDRITDVGDFEPGDHDARMDASGLVLAPGFIDVHSHHDIGLLEMPEALAAVNQGITTIVAGQDGSQEAYPLAEFFAKLETSPAAVNVASYAGHGTLRSEVMGDDYQRLATENEIGMMVNRLEEEMAAGALGLTTGLEYDPGSFSTTGELIELAKTAAASGGHYMSHIRSEDQFFWEAIDELLEIGREARIPVHVSHVKLAMTRWWGQADQLMAKLDVARTSGIDVTADVYPYRAWNTEFSWLRTLFPDRDLTRREGAKYILRDMLSPEGVFLARYFPDPAYDGLTIAEIARILESDPESTLMALLEADVETGSRSSMLGFAMDEPDIEAIMAWPHTVIGSDGELVGPHPRGYGAFTRFLGHYVRDRGVVSLEEGIRKVTSLSAKILGIEERGSIRPGFYADLVLFDPASVADRATPEAPWTPSVGIEKVWVNGELVFANGLVTGNTPGRPIRRINMKKN